MGEQYRYWMQYPDNHIEAHFFTLEIIENHRGLNRKALFEAGIKILARDRYAGIKDIYGRKVYEGDRVAKFDFADTDLQSTVICKLGAFGYIANEDFISFAQNYHFEWRNEQSKKIKIVKRGCPECEEESRKGNREK